jgi:signal peptidase II
MLVQLSSLPEMTQAIISAILVVAALVVFLLRFSRGKIWLAVALGVVILDQLIKQLALKLAGDGQRLPLSHAAGLVFAKNSDLGFGASDSGLLSATIASVVVLILLYLRLSHFGYRMGAVTELASALIVGGCLGILIDRVGRGFVVDWLDLGPKSQFIYNLADLAVMLAAVLFIARVIHFFAKKENRQMLAMRNARGSVFWETENETASAASAEAAGRSAARALRDRYKDLSPQQLAETLGLQIQREIKSECAPPGLVVRSEYRCEPPTVVLYLEPLQELAGLVAARRPELAALDFEALHIAHEIYHFLEAGGPADSETAAHAFVEELLHLNFSPHILDTLYADASS